MVERGSASGGSRKNNNLIDALVTCSVTGWSCRIRGIYGPLVFEDRKGVWEGLKKKDRRVFGAWCCMGDFNDIREYDEKE